MILVMQPTASEKQIQNVMRTLERQSFQVHRSTGVKYTILAAISDDESTDHEFFAKLPGVERVFKSAKPYKLAAREFKPEGTVITIGNVVIGKEDPVVMASMDVIESEENITSAVEMVAECGLRILCSKAIPLEPEETALQRLRAAADERGLFVAIEVADTAHIDRISRYADLLQIGSHSMPNFALLRAVGQTGRPVLLTRNIAAKVDELLLAAERILATGNHSVILCEQGIRTFDDHSRFLLDLGVISAVKELSHLPIIVNPSRSTDQAEHILPLALAGIAAGADGLMIEVCPMLGRFSRQSDTSLDREELRELLRRIRTLSQNLHWSASHAICTQ